MGNKYISAPEFAKLLGVNRTAVFKRIVSGDIKAEKIGRSYAITQQEVKRITQGVLTNEVSDSDKVTLQKPSIQKWKQKNCCCNFTHVSIQKQKMAFCRCQVPVRIR